MKKVVIIRYSEIHLKGNNRGYFEKALLANIKLALKGIEAKVVKYNGRYFVNDFSELDLKDIISRLQTVFGIHSFSVATEIETSKEDIFNFFSDFRLSGKTFKVETTRADKHFEIKSMDLSRDIGEVILNNNENLKVDVHNPETTVNIDIRENGHTYIFFENIAGLKGMPVGTAGRGLVMLSGGIDSPVAAYKIAKRGMNVTAIHFHSFPYTSEQSKSKVVKLAGLIRPYTHLHKVLVIPFTKIQEEIHKNCREEYTITLMRRFMVRIAERVAETYKCQAIITGESLGQVASQTVESITSTNIVAKKLPILRPLIALDKEEIIEIARQINTFETSILPYEDCCTVFLPKSPVIKPKLEKVEAEEARLDIESLTKEAIDHLEEIIIE